MKIYLAGPMRGYPEFNFPAFHKAAAELRAQGHEVFNPAEEDLKEFETIETVTETYDADPDTMRRHVMRKDVLAILDWAEVIALLPGWETSSGVKVEKALAEYLHLQEIYL